MLKKRLSRKFRMARGSKMEGVGKIRLLWSSGASGFLHVQRTPMQGGKGCHAKTFS